MNNQITNIKKSLEEENEKISKLKDRMIEFVSKAIEEGLKYENKIYFLKHVASFFESIDKVSRLNQSMATEIKEERKIEINLDVAKVLKELDTPEKKKKFLMDQLNK